MRKYLVLFALILIFDSIHDTYDAFVTFVYRSEKFDSIFGLYVFDIILAAIVFISLPFFISISLKKNFEIGELNIDRTTSEVA